MALFTSTYSRSSCSLTNRGWHEVTFTEIPSLVAALFLGREPVVRRFIRKDWASQWYESSGLNIRPVSIQREIWLTDRWDAHETIEELRGQYVEEPPEDEGPRPTA